MVGVTSGPEPWYSLRSAIVLPHSLQSQQLLPAKTHSWFETGVACKSTPYLVLANSVLVAQIRNVPFSITWYVHRVTRSPGAFFLAWQQHRELLLQLDGVGFAGDFAFAVSVYTSVVCLLIYIHDNPNPKFRTRTPIGTGTWLQTWNRSLVPSWSFVASSTIPILDLPTDRQQTLGLVERSCLKSDEHFRARFEGCYRAPFRGTFQKLTLCH